MENVNKDGSFYKALSNFYNYFQPQDPQNVRTNDFFKIYVRKKITKFYFLILL